MWTQQERTLGGILSEVSEMKNWTTTAFEFVFKAQWIDLVMIFLDTNLPKPEPFHVDKMVLMLH